ncbi:MAG TPA: hypothetical protein VHX61_10100 [Rhizomicrobium sp.]|jgi:hypothetical protein|nr:hypothetical protein [Rhizomicrobium sp.]
MANRSRANWFRADLSEETGMESAAICREQRQAAASLARARSEAPPARPAIRSLEAPWPVLAIFAGAVLLVLPLWIAPMPAMPDYPAHLASFYLLAGGAKSPLLAQFYHVQWAFVPNLAAEAIVPPLAPVIGLGAATAVFLSAAVLLWVLGAGAVQWALWRRIGIAPLFAGFFAYNANFMWGFFNYFFAMGLAFIAFAGWIADTKRRSPFHLAAFASAVLAIYFCHLFAAAVLILLIGCYEISGIERPLSLSNALRRGAAVAAICVPALLAFLLLRPAAGGGLFEFNLRDTIGDRLSAAVQFCFDQPAWILFAGLVALFAAGLWRRRIVLHPRMTLVLVVLLLGCAFAPEWAMGGWGVDLRLPAVLGTLAFAAAGFRFERRTGVALVVAALVITAWCAAALSGNWLYYDRRFAEFRAAAKSLPPGSRLVTVLDGDAMGLASDQPYWHMAEYAIIDRQAFTPLLFTTRGQHVIRLQPSVERIAASTAEQGSPPDISELDDLAAGNANDDPDIRKVFPYLIRFQCHFDYAVVIHLGGHRSPVPDMLALAHAGSFFSLYRIRPDENCRK